MAVCSLADTIDPCIMALSPWQLELVKTQMLCGIKNFLESSEPVTCDIQDLLDEAQCFNGVQPAVLSAIQAQLLCDISNLL